MLTNFKNGVILHSTKQKLRVKNMEIKTYRTNNKRFPWTAEDSEGHSVNAVTKDAAINALKNIYQLLPKASIPQNIGSFNEVKL